MKTILAKSAGFCFGVRRAVRLCENAAETCTRCVTLGPIIHNTSVTSKLAEQGVDEISCIEDVLPSDTVIIRSHGARRSEMDALAKTGADVIDATCPDVAKIHKIVRTESNSGRKILIIGERNHPEIEAISSWCEDCVIFEAAQELRNWLDASPDCKEQQLAIVFQTTNTQTVFEECSTMVKKECTNIEIFDTICNATCKRQEEAKEISRVVDAMIVIGGKSSANSKKLAKICRENCGIVYFIETADDLDISNFSKSDTIGITAGASTPAWIIKEVCQMLNEEMNPEETTLDEQVVENNDLTGGTTDEQVVENNDLTGGTTDEQVVENNDLTGGTTDEQVVETKDLTGGTTDEQIVETNDIEDGTDEVEETFAEMLEKSIKTLHTGQKVTGTVAAITATEISVDLGTKQSGYIPFAELTDDPTIKVEDLVTVGDSIETFVLRVNDVEGTVMLSKKRLDSIKNWEDIDTARIDKTVVEGFVTEENKGGIVVSVKGVRVFVPASQTGLSKEVQMSTLIKTKVKLRITEVNQSRRRVVGSIRAIQNDERREKMELIWNEIEIAKTYRGVVKSMTSYGAFIDIGGIDGMVHVSELSWTRINQPSDILNIGDQIEVYVIAFDKEKKKISLGYKKKEDNPWEKFVGAYQIGGTANVKIVKLMPFGAFAEIVPGVDGLIHISQITDHRIGLPSEILAEGDMVDVKITDIDMDKHKVSLSIRALLEQQQFEPSYDSEPVVLYDTDAPPAATDGETE